jgi:hypothetical protein
MWWTYRQTAVRSTHSGQRYGCCNWLRVYKTHERLTIITEVERRRKKRQRNTDRASCVVTSQSRVVMSTVDWSAGSSDKIICARHSNSALRQMADSVLRRRHPGAGYFFLETFRPRYIGQCTLRRLAEKLAPDLLCFSILKTVYARIGHRCRLPVRIIMVSSEHYVEHQT